MNIIWISKISMDIPHKTSRLKMAEALRKRGNNVILYMMKKIGNNAFYGNDIVLIPTIDVPILSSIFFGLTVFFYFPIALNKKQIDIIIIDCTKVWIPFIIPLKIFNIPIILDIRTLPIDREKSFYFDSSLYLSRYIINGISTITSELKNMIREKYDIENTKIGVWSSGVSVEDFNRDEIGQSKLFEDISKKFILIYHGDYSPTRGIENLIKSISKLSLLVRNNIILVIIGIPTDKINQLSLLSELEGVKDQIRFFQKTDYTEIIHYIKNSDVGIIPLPPENKWWRVSAPLKTLEYLAAEKPIIATNIPFHQDIFKRGNCGILIGSSKPVEIAKAIDTMYKKRKEMKKFGITGRKIVEKFYTWDLMAKKYELFLETFSKK